MEGSIIFVRQTQFYGVIVPIKIYVDGKDMGSMNAGERKKVITPVGKHKIAFNVWSGNGQYDIELTEEHPNIQIDFNNYSIEIDWVSYSYEDLFIFFLWTDFRNKNGKNV